MDIYLKFYIISKYCSVVLNMYHIDGNFLTVAYTRGIQQRVQAVNTLSSSDTETDIL
jgi:hypothetical protein